MTTHVMNATTIGTAGDHGHESSPLASWFRTTSTRLTIWWARRQSYRQTVRELSSLSDRELDDIGVVRCDILRIALQGVEKAPTIR